MKHWMFYWRLVGILLVVALVDCFVAPTHRSSRPNTNAINDRNHWSPFVPTHDPYTSYKVLNAHLQFRRKDRHNDSTKPSNSPSRRREGSSSHLVTDRISWLLTPSSSSSSHPALEKRQTEFDFSTPARKGKVRWRSIVTTALLLMVGRPAHAAATASRVARRLRVAAAVVATALLWSEIRLAQKVRRRQAKDPTSEWGRFADKPAARGRAAMALTFRILCSRKKEDRGPALADGLLRLGPLYVKMGQILSCRDNLLPESWIEALAVLQDRVPAQSGAAARALAVEAFGGQERFDEILKTFDDVPLAAASLGQVHRGTLRADGAEVAVKLQRPRLRDIYDQDLALMKSIASTVDKVRSYLPGSASSGPQQSWTEIFANAEEILYREIDYNAEAQNARRFADDFGLGINGTSTIPSAVLAAKSNPTGDKDGQRVIANNIESASEWLRTPYVYTELSSEKALVMEYVPSIKINNYEALEKAGVTQDDRDALAESLARAYLRQFCVHKFFSTDPHPGNLGVEVADKATIASSGKKPRPPRLVLYDFGQACELQDNQSRGILSVLEGIIDADAPKCVQAFQEMGVLVEGADLQTVTRKVQQNFDEGKLKRKQKKKGINKSQGSVVNGSSSTSSGTNASTPTTDKISNKQVKDSEVMPYFTLPAEYAFVARAIAQMDGVGTGLDPDFDFCSASAPYLVIDIKGAENYAKDEFFKVIDKVQKWEQNLFKRLGFDFEMYKKA